MKILSISDAIAKKAEQRKRLYEALTSIDNTMKRVKLAKIDGGTTASILGILGNIRAKLKNEHDKLGV